MIQKLVDRIQLYRIIRAKKSAVKNGDLETAARCRDEEKRLSKKMGISDEKTSMESSFLRYVKRWEKIIGINVQLRKLKRKLRKIKKQEVYSIRKLNYQEVNILQDQKNALKNKIERWEYELEKLKSKI